MSSPYYTLLNSGPSELEDEKKPQKRISETCISVFHSKPAFRTLIAVLVSSLCINLVLAITQLQGRMTGNELLRTPYGPSFGRLNMMGVL